MLIECNQCQKTLKVPDTAAGKKIRCPACQAVLSVPLLASAVEPQPDPATDRPAQQTGEARKATIISRLAPRSPAVSENADARRSATSRDSDSQGSQSRTSQPPSRSSSERSRAARGSAAGGRSAAAGGRAGRSPGAPASTGRSSARRRRASTEDDYDDEYEDYDDPWSTSQSYDDQAWDDANPYAAPKSRSTATRGRRRGADCTTAGTGLMVCGYSTVAIIAMVAFALFGSMAAGGMTRNAATAASAGMVVGGLLGIGVLIAGLSILVGEFLCLTIPPETGAKGLITGAIGCLIGQLILNITGQFVDPGAVAVGIALLSMVLAIAHFVLFVLFMKAGASYVGRDDLARRSMTILIGIVASFLIMISSSLLLGVVGRSLGGGAALFLLIPMLVSVIALLVFAVGYVFLQIRIGTALRSG